MMNMLNMEEYQVPSPSSALYGKLIQRLREIMPNKLITAFYYGYAGGFKSISLITCGLNFGSGWSAPSGFAHSKWASVNTIYPRASSDREI